MKKYLSVLMLLVFVAACGVAAMAKVTLYIQNKKVKAKLVAKGQQFYAPVQVVEGGLACKIAVNAASGEITVNGEAIEQKALVQDGETLVPLKTIAKKLGFNYIYNKSTEMVDLNRIVAGTVDSAATSQGTGGSGTGEPVQGGNNGNTPQNNEYNNFQPPSDGGQEQASINWFQDIPGALNAARADKSRKVMINFYRLDEPSKQLYDNFESPQVKALLTNMICAAVDGEQDAASAQKYKITSLPCVVFMNANGAEIARFDGVKQPDEIATFIKTMVMGK